MRLLPGQAGERPAPRGDVFARLDLEAQRLQRLDGQLQRLALESGVGGADEADGVAGPKASGQQCAAFSTG
jgi:hypothetical protein